jgi:outer membrane protein assembly factor BamB
MNQGLPQWLTSRRWPFLLNGLLVGMFLLSACVYSGSSPGVNAPAVSSPSTCIPPRSDSGSGSPSPSVFIGPWVGGNNQSSISTLRADDGTLRWQYKTDVYKPTVITDAGVVYVAGQVVTGPSRFSIVYALRASDGAVLWKTSLDTTAVSWLFLWQKQLFALDVLGGTIFSLQSANGKLLWSTSTSPVFSQQPILSQQIVDGVLYVTVNDVVSAHGSLYAFDAQRGTRLWQYGAHYGSLLQPFVLDGVVYITDVPPLLRQHDHSRVVALQASDGMPLWQYEQQDAAGFSPPVVSNGVVYLGNSNILAGRNAYLYALQAKDGSLLWKTNTGTRDNIEEAPLIMEEGIVYLATVFHPTLLALRAHDGTLLWKNSHEFIPAMNPQPGWLISRDAVYAVDGKTSVSALCPANGKAFWRTPLASARGPLDTPVVVVNGSVYITDSLSGTLYALKTQDGSQVWRYRITPFPSDVTTNMDVSLSIAVG